MKKREFAENEQRIVGNKCLYKCVWGGFSGGGGGVDLFVFVMLVSECEAGANFVITRIKRRRGKKKQQLRQKLKRRNGKEKNRHLNCNEELVKRAEP